MVRGAGARLLSAFLEWLYLYEGGRSGRPYISQRGDSGDAFASIRWEIELERRPEFMGRILTGIQRRSQKRV